ncbi:HEAT repeat domain-containing protein [Roseibium album]|uniref:HEAT repeat domain-containing protein n=1 Tax=Roseibium album TaxID=311410 RepID=UPI00391D6167
MTPESAEVSETLVLGSEVEGNLLTIAQSGTPAEQCLAIKALGAWAPPSARTVLLEATHNADPDVRVDALQTLVKLEETNLGKDFMWSLENDPVGEAKIAALRGLCREDRDLASSLLQRLILDRCEEDVAWEDEVADWDDWLDIQKEVIHTVGRLGIQDAVDVLLTAANDEFGQDLWRETLEALAGLGRPGLLALIDAGQSASERHRERAARALGASRDSMAIKALDALSQDKVANVRLAALETMLERKAPLFDARLIEDQSGSIRAFAAARSPTIATDNLIQLAISDEDKMVRLAAARRLSERRPSAAQIGRLVNHAKLKLRHESEDFVAALVEILAESGSDEAFELLMEIKTRNPKPDIQRAVLTAFSRFENPEVLEHLADGITSGSQMVRLSALVSLAALSRGSGEIADNAAAVLLLAARGGLVSEEEETKEKEKNGGQEEAKQFGARARDDDGGNKNRIVLDREGNIVPQETSSEPAKLSDYRNPEEATPTGDTDLDLPPENEAEASVDALAEDGADVVAFPQSTLSAILQGDVEQAEFQEEKIDLSEEDLKFLELAQSTLQKKRVRPDVAPNTALDIRRIAVRLIGEQVHSAFTPVLLEALNARDDELRAAALRALLHRCTKGVALEASDWSRLANQPPDNHLPARAAYLELLAFAPKELAMPHLEAALADEANMAQAAALATFEIMKIVPPQVPGMLHSGDRGTRRAALKLVCGLGETDRTDALVQATFEESGALWAELAAALKKRGACPLTANIIARLDEACLKGGVNRQIALQVLSGMGDAKDVA